MSLKNSQYFYFRRCFGTVQLLEVLQFRSRISGWSYSILIFNRNRRKSCHFSSTQLAWTICYLLKRPYQIDNDCIKSKNRIHTHSHLYIYTGIPFDILSFVLIKSCCHSYLLLQLIFTMNVGSVGNQSLLMLMSHYLLKAWIKIIKMNRRFTWST